MCENAAVGAIEMRREWKRRVDTLLISAQIATLIFPTANDKAGSGPLPALPLHQQFIHIV
jgi:hypothetical protein